MTTTRLARTFPLVFISTLLCFGQSSSAPASVIARFAGTWKENEAKAKIGSVPGLRFRASADGGLEEVRGSDVAPLVQPVHFDGKQYAVDAGKNTLAWKQNGQSQFERQIFESGQLVSTRRITISNDGKTLTEVTEQKLQDGTTFLGTTVYSRSSGEGTGLAGIWKPQSRHSNNPQQMTVSAAGANSLRWSSRAGVTYTAALDDKPVSITGPAVISGTMIAYKRIDDHTLVSTSSRNGVVTANSTLTLSPDGKVLTVTSTQVGPNAGKEPSVTVYGKQ
jgi:hypothetical protein